jgi:zinc transport system permease protein
MSAFFQDLLTFSFLQYALITLLFASLCCGVVGSLVVVRRSTYLAGALSHCVMGGLGLSRYLQVVHGWQWFSPMIGSLLAAISAAALIALLNWKAKERMDTLLSAVWSLGMAAGILFVMRTPGYHEDLMGFLFGDLLLVTRQDLILLGILGVIMTGVILLRFPIFKACSFNPELTLLRGVKVATHETLLLIMIAITVVLLVRVVGITLAIAMLTLPAATAARFTHSLASMMRLGILLCAGSSLLGLMLAYPLNLPTGPVIILISVTLYLLSAWVGTNRSRGQA